MKSILLAGALLLAALTNKTFANDVKVTPVVQQAFQQTFFDAANVQWSEVDRLYRADFTVDGEQMIAFYSIDYGSLVATGRYLNVAQLSRPLQNSLAEYTASATLVNIFEVQDDTRADRFAELQKDGKTLVLKAEGKKWSIYKNK